MAFMFELKELPKKVEIESSSNESDEDFMKRAIKEKTLMGTKLIPITTDYLDTKNETASAMKLQIAIECSNRKKISTELINVYFNQAVAYALPETKILIKAYMNRYILLMNNSMYDEALNNIDHAIDNTKDHPEELVVDLYIKKARSLLALNRNFPAGQILLQATEKLNSPKMKEVNKSKARVELQKLSIELMKHGNLTSLGFEGQFRDLRPNLFPPPSYQRDNGVFITVEDKKFQTVSPKVRVIDHDKLGYYLAAQKDIEAGEHLVIERILANVIKCNERYSRCWNCTKYCWSCLPCLKCSNVIFCSENCRSEAWVRHHDIECQIISILLYHRNFYNEQYLMSLRLFIIALKECKNIKKLQRLVKTIEKECKEECTDYYYVYSQYRAVYCMSRDPMEKNSKDKHASAMVYYTYCLAATTEVFGRKIKDPTEFLTHPWTLFVGKLLFHHVMLIDTNMIPLRQQTLCKNGKIYGGAILPLMNLCSHEDYPNAYQFFCRDYIILTSMYCIKEGELIRTSLGPNYMKMVTKEKRDILFKKHKFWKMYESCLSDRGPGSPFQPCLNHFENDVVYDEIRLFFNELSISKLSKWSSNRSEEVPVARMLTIINILFKYITQHDKKTPILCINVESVKWLLYYIYDFIDSYEL